MLPELYPRAFFAYDFRGYRITAKNPTTRPQTFLLLSYKQNKWASSSQEAHSLFMNK